MLSERDVLKQSIQVLKKVYRQWVKIERRQVAQFQNPGGQWLRFGRKGESDLGGWILQGPYIAKPIVIEVKRGDFRTTRLYGKDKIHFKEQCDFMRGVIREGGVAFWVNDPGQLHAILAPVLFRGARVTLDLNNHVIVTQLDVQQVIDVKPL